VEHGDATDCDGLRAATIAAQAVTDKPSLIKVIYYFSKVYFRIGTPINNTCCNCRCTQVRTTIGLGSKNEGTEKVHGSPLGAVDLAAVKTKVVSFFSV
jgi:transketolase